jgi:hypothetical protein
MTENLPKSTLIPDDKLKKLWKMAVTASLDPDNEYQAYKLYYILLRKEIVENYAKEYQEGGGE